MILKGELILETTWSLKELYDSFSSQDFLDDLKHLDTLIKSYHQFAESLPIADEAVVSTLEHYLDFQLQFNDLFQKLFSFCSLTLSTDTSNEEALKYSDILNEKSSSLAKSETAINHWIGNLEALDLSLDASERLKEHQFFFKEIQLFSRYLLSENEEAIIAKMQNTGSTAWSKLKDTLTSQLMVDIPLEGKIKSMPLTMARNLAHDTSSQVRKNAYEAELKAYSKIEDALAAALSNIKGEVITTSSLRGYESPLQETLMKSRMKQETLQAMLEAMQESLPIFRNFLKTKARLLGHKGGLPFYDLFAPMGGHSETFDYKNGTAFVLKQFETFSKSLAEYAKGAIEKAWIDVYPKQGKVGGAFCSNLHVIKESRFLLNYGDQFSDVVTLSHELGHGFHGYCLTNESSLNSSYPMPLAETASTFCETIVKKAAIKNGSEDEVFAILEAELTDSTQIIVDIYSRYLFETALFSRRKESSIGAKELNDLMIKAQKEAYGDGLDPEYLHPYMWACKPHYYDASTNFYNFPYAFGLLFAKGLYAKYLEQGTDFVQAYEQLLSITGKNTAEEVAQTVGIDLTSKKFWQQSLKIITDDIQMFEELAQKKLQK